MAKLLLLNGPNLNLLGLREPSHYGNQTLAEITQQLEKSAQDKSHQLIAKQTNHEGELISFVHQAQDEQIDFIIINPAGYTHTSIALRDALLAVKIPFIEVHLSNVYARETFRHHSFLSDIAVGVISGLGPIGYQLALLAAENYLTTRKKP